MNKFIVLLIFSISISTYSQNKSEKKFLAKYIDSLKTENSLAGNPVVVIDGYLRNYDLKDKNSLLIEKKDIFRIEYIKKENAEIYGSINKFGVISILTRLSQTKKLNRAFIHPVSSIYILDGKIVTKDFIDKFDRKKIDSVTIITDLEKIKEYTTDSYDELISITTRLLTE